jgi:hypothetical protein
VHTGSTSHEAVTDLAAYRRNKESERAIAIERQLDAEETITEIARYVLLIVQAIKRPRH